VLKFYDFARSNLPQRAFAGISFQSKADCIPLAVCDMLAYGVYLVETGGKRIGDPRKPLKSSKSYRHDSTKKLRIGADGLNGLYLQSIQMYEERQKFGRRVSLSGNAA
jgi:hypothetical protein